MHVSEKNVYTYIYISFCKQEYVGYWSQTRNGLFSRWGTNTKVKANLVGRQQCIAFQHGLSTACISLLQFWVL